MAAPEGVHASGDKLIDKAGMTLYTFDKDPAGTGKSMCNDGCAKNWPPLMASAGEQPSGDWTVIARDDGGRQLAYRGKPLYRWVKDQKSGDTTGDGFRGVWHVARP
ncbi:MAG: COG4315 family predicted lipoprotein [Burkholderiales bacterium]